VSILFRGTTSGKGSQGSLAKEQEGIVAFFPKSGLFILVMSVAALAGATATHAGSGTTTLVSVSTEGVQGDAISQAASVSADGRFVTFVSDATTFVPGDQNFTFDLFVRDRQELLTTRDSISAASSEGNSWSGTGSISADGRFVAFSSGASNLAPEDTNEAPDIFVHDRVTGDTERASLASSGEQGNGWSVAPAISADGRFVAFRSDATNLVAGDTNGVGDVFVHDRETGETRRVSVSSLGEQANNFSEGATISGDGRFVAFHSFATNLVPEDTNARPDVFVHDLASGVTELVSVSSAGVLGDGSSFAPSITPDGSVVAFASLAQNLVGGDTNGEADIFVRDRASGTTQRVSLSTGGAQGNGRSDLPSISADGDRIAFQSLANTLVEGDTNNAQDIFLNDRATGETTRVSVSTPSLVLPRDEANGPSFSPAISADGMLIAFSSLASNLVDFDLNEWGDVFAYDLHPTVPFGWKPSTHVPLRTALARRPSTGRSDRRK